MWSRLSGFVLASTLAATVAQAQEVQPTLLEFLPSPDHSATVNGQAVVTRYDAVLSQAGTAYGVVDLGKPALQADGVVRLAIGGRLPVPPVPGSTVDLRVAAVGPGGTAVSLPAAPFYLPAGTARFLSDLAWVSATNGWGPVERDRSNGEDLAGDGRVLTLNGRTFTKGLGAHAASDIRYALDGTCSFFAAVVGVDDEVSTRGTVRFQLWRDGVLALDTGTMTGADAGRAVAADITGARDLRLVVGDAGDGVTSDHADWADARVYCGGTAPPPAPSTRWLSDLVWSSATNGWGPVERDRSNGESLAGDGRTLTLNGKTYAKGLGVHAASSVTYALGGTCSRLEADLGVDDEVGNRGSVVFQVTADGVRLYDSGRMTGKTATKRLSLDVTGRRALTLVVTDNADGTASDHGDWADARLTCTTFAAATVTP